MRCIPGAVLRTSLIKSEIKWYIHDDIIANQDLANSVLRTHLLLMISIAELSYLRYLRVHGLG